MGPIDIDPEDIAMFMGMAEEMAEEQRFERERKEQADEFFEENTDERFDTGASRGSNRIRHKSDFWRYVEDVCAGRKQPGDPMDTGYDYKRQIPVPKSDRRVKPVRIQGVPVFQWQLVSEKFLSVISDVLERYPEHRARGIVFNARGYPRKNDIPLFGVYIRRSGLIVLNLKRHFDNALRIACDVNANYSIRGLIWYSMNGTLLHELHHSMTQTMEDDPMGEARQQVEAMANEWAKTQLTALAGSMDLEPPKMEDEPYFSACFNALMQQQEETGRRQWVEHQKLLLDANVLYWDPETCLAYPTMKELCGIVPEDRGVAPEGLDREGYADRTNRAAEAYWEEDEKKEAAIKEAIAMGYRLKIDYTDRNGRFATGRVIVPFRVFYRNGYLFVEAFCEQRRANRCFRISRINGIAFLP